MAAALGKVTKPKLTPRERRFFFAYIESHQITASYKIISPDASNEVASAAGSRLLRRIKSKIAWETFLDEAGLGIDRLLVELNRKMSAKITKHYQDEKLGDFDDNATQMRAVELLADLLGVRKQIDVKHSGTILYLDSVIYEAVHGHGTGRAGGNGKPVSAVMDN